MGEIVALAQLCTMEHVQFKVIPSFFQIFASALHLENIGGVPIMGVSKLPLDYLHNRFIKRRIDIIGADRRPDPLASRSSPSSGS